MLARLRRGSDDEKQAAARGINMADSELALKELSARTAELPLALRAAQMEQEVRMELEAEESAEEKQLP